MEAKQETAVRTHGMKAKTIKRIVRRKIDNWVETIEDKALQIKVKQSVILTGGSIASMLIGQDVNDFDIYFRDHDTALAMAHYYLNKFVSRKNNGIKAHLKVRDEDGRIKIVVQSAGIASEEGTDKPYQYFEGQPDESAAAYVGDVINDPAQIEDTYQEITELSEKTEDKKKNKETYRPVFLTTNAITLSGGIQLILRFYGEPDQIHENYDFIHCTNYWKSWDGELVLRPAALEALLSKELKYVGSKYPICSMVRLRKFITRGWHVNAGQIVKMAMQISELDLKNFKVLEDQLTGVDTTYFVQLLERMKEKDPEKVDAAYLIEIIDRIF
jgi:hypothetical protein